MDDENSDDGWTTVPDEPDDGFDAVWEGAYSLGEELSLYMKIIVANETKTYLEKNPDADRETVIEAVWAAIYDHM